MKRWIHILIIVILVEGVAGADEKNDTKKDPEAQKRERIVERLSQLNHKKLQALFDYAGIQERNGFYGCLCANAPGVASVGVAKIYHPLPMEPYNEDYSCNSYGPPCIASGMGCWRFSLPKDRSVWDDCLKKVRVDDNKSLVDALLEKSNAIKEERERLARQKRTEELKRKYTYFDIPSDIDGYTKKFDAYLRALRAKGYPVERIKKINAMIRRHIMRLKTPGEMSGWLKSMGILSSHEDSISLKAWRKEILKKYDKLFLNLIKKGDPLTIYKGMRKFSGALSNFDDAVMTQCEAALDEMAARQTLIKDLVESAPVAGDFLDAYALIGYLGERAGLTKSSNWTLNGDEVTTLDAVLRFAGVGGPQLLSGMMKQANKFRVLVHEIGKMRGNFGKASKEIIAKILKKMSNSVRGGLETVHIVLTRERHMWDKKTAQKIESMAEWFNGTKKGREALQRELKDIKNANTIVDTIKYHDPGSLEFKKAVQELQANKTAQGLINKDIVANDELRKKVNQEIKGWYKITDKHSTRDIKRLLTANEKDVEKIAGQMNIDLKQAKKIREDVAELCQKHGIDVSEIRVEPLTITNKRTKLFEHVSVGRDRDVTYQIKKIDSHGKTVAIMDVDHKVSQKIYEKNFYKQFHEGKLPGNSKEMHRWVHEHMDQTVTSKWHPEAYNTGEVKLNDFLDKGVTPTLTRVEDVADTVAYKSHVWFERAAKETNVIMKTRNIREGMRQANKQWKDLILSRGKQYGLKSYNYPKDLVGTMKVFKDVADEKITVEAGDYILKKLYKTDREGVVRRMSGFLLGMEKTAGRAYRQVTEKGVERTVKAIYHHGGSNAAEKALTHLNDALCHGKISGKKFRELHQKIVNDTVAAIKDPVAKKRWIQKSLEGRLISKSEALAVQEK